MVVADYYVPVVMSVIKACVYLYEYITWPIYYLFNKTGHFMPLADETHSEFGDGSRTLSLPIRDDDPSSPWRAVEYIDELATVPQPGCRTLVDLWLRSVRLWPDKEVFGTREILDTDYEVLPNGRKLVKLTLGKYLWETFSNADLRISRLCAAIYELLGPNTKNASSLLVFSETRAEWVYAAQTAFRLNRPLATLYATLGDDAIVHGLNETQAELVFTSDELLCKMVPLCKRCPNVKYIVYFTHGIFYEPGTPIDNKSRFSETAYDSVEKGKAALHENVQLFDIVELEQRGQRQIESSQRESPAGDSGSHWMPPKEESAEPDDLAVIMYTSGSTGTPKGVEITHHNLMCAIAGHIRRLPKLRFDDDVFIAYLPLAHVLELVCEFSCLMLGIHVGYSHPQTLTTTSTRIQKSRCIGDINLLRPTLFSAVPTILERISKSVWEKVTTDGPLTEAIFRFAYDYKCRRLHTGFPSFLVDFLIFRKVRALMGGRMRYLLCGGAPLSKESQLFTNICFAPIIQGYGLTETCSAGSLMEIGDLRSGQVGAPSPCLQFKLREWEAGGYSPRDKPFPRGELLIAGGSVCRGYFKQPELTAKEFFTDKEGVRWFCTGDIAMVHVDGSFSIIDRKKDLVKLQAGEYISLGKVELALSQSQYVDNVCVFVDPMQNYSICFVSPKPSQVRRLAEELKLMDALANVKATLSPERLIDPQAVLMAEHAVLCKLGKINKTILEDLKRMAVEHRLMSFEIPQKMHLDPDQWTPETGLVTDALKIKRFNIQTRFQAEISQMYNKNTRE